MDNGPPTRHCMYNGPQSPYQVQYMQWTTVLVPGAAHTQWIMVAAPGAVHPTKQSPCARHHTYDRPWPLCQVLCLQWTMVPAPGAIHTMYHSPRARHRTHNGPQSLHQVLYMLQTVVPVPGAAHTMDHSPCAGQGSGSGLSLGNKPTQLTCQARERKGPWDVVISDPRKASHESLSHWAAPSGSLVGTSTLSVGTPLALAPSPAE